LACLITGSLVSPATPTRASPKQATATYAQAKAIAEKNGFAATPMNHAKDKILCGGDDLCIRRPEVFFCSGVGSNFCDFAYYRKSDHIWVVIETFGDDANLTHEVRRASKLDLERIKEHRAAGGR
jgi:hypothetical protein